MQHTHLLEMHCSDTIKNHLCDICQGNELLVWGKTFVKKTFFLRTEWTSLRQNCKLHYSFSGTIMLSVRCSDFFITIYLWCWKLELSNLDQFLNSLYCKYSDSASFWNSSCLPLHTFILILRLWSQMNA